MTTPTTPTCLHLGAGIVGYTQTPLQRPDAAVAGLVAHTSIASCPRCGALVAAVELHPKGSNPVLTTPGFVVLQRAGGAS